MPAYAYRWARSPASNRGNMTDQNQGVEYLNELASAGWRVVPGIITFGEMGTPYYVLMEKIAEDESG